MMILLYHEDQDVIVPGTVESSRHIADHHESIGDREGADDAFGFRSRQEMADLSDDEIPSYQSLPMSCAKPYTTAWQ